MVKTYNESQVGASDEIAKLKKLQNIGDYFALRRTAKKLMSKSELNSKVREGVLEIVRRTEPNPLVFLIGIGSVVAAFLSAVWLTY